MVRSHPYLRQIVARAFGFSNSNLVRPLLTSESLSLLSYSRFVANIAGFVEMCKRAHVTLPELCLFYTLIIEETLSKVLRIGNRLARGIGSAALHTSLEGGSTELIRVLIIVTRNVVETCDIADREAGDIGLPAGGGVCVKFVGRLEMLGNPTAAASRKAATGCMASMWAAALNDCEAKEMAMEKLPAIKEIYTSGDETLQTGD